MLARTILGEATLGQGSLAEAIAEATAEEATAAERNRIGTRLAEGIADNRNPLSCKLY